MMMVMTMIKEEFVDHRETLCQENAGIYGQMSRCHGLTAEGNMCKECRKASNGIIGLRSRETCIATT